VDPFAAAAEGLPHVAETAVPRASRGESAEIVVDAQEKDLARRPLVIGLTVWLVCLPIWLGVTFFAAAGGGFYPGTSLLKAIGLTLFPFGGPWLILDANIYRWWKQGRQGLWRPPLAWFLLLIPYVWPALLVPRVRRWWSRLATAR